MYKAATRALGETNWPDPLIGLKFEANMLMTNVNAVVWETLMSRMYGHTNFNADTRQVITGAAITSGKENGVYAINFNKDFFLHRPGGETRRGYLQTSPGSNWIFNGNMGAAGNLYSIVNYVAPGGGTVNRQNTAALTGGQ
jgi:hypothetical protein